MAFSKIVPHLSQQQTRELAEKGMRAITRLRNLASSMEEQMGQGVQTMEVSIATFGWAFARGYFAEPGKDFAALGVPLDLGAGFLGHAAAYFGGSAVGRYKRDVHNVSDGSIASYLATLGLKLGLEQAQKKHAAPAPAAASGAGFDVSELVRRAAAAV